MKGLGPPGTVESTLDELYRIFQKDISFERKARDALEVGTQFLGADNGHLTRIDQETDHWKAVVSTDPPDGEFPPGLELDLQTTYCRHVLETDSQVAFNDAPNQGFAEDPAYEAHGVHCYVGTPLRINDEQYGTVSFVATDPRSGSYSESEKILAELITHMLGRDLEREQFETQLMRQTNLSLVLNRVLRHNLRNKMVVIRGYTQLIAEKLADSDFGRKALRSIDSVLDLSEKARELDKIIASDAKRHRRNVRPMVEEVIGDVRSDYPAATISIDGEANVPAAIRPSFRRAVGELIENAVKHGGDQPTVDVTVELIPDGLEIRIADDGPGLDAQEIDVLRSGSETPLIHGSGLGLWLAHWIISSHDGSIEPSVTDAGTTLTITIPRTPVADGERPIRDLLRARDQYKAAFEDAGDGMMITNDDARILEVNDEAARIFGVDKQELLGRSLQEYLSDDFDFEAEWGEIRNSEKMRDEMRIMSADGGVSNIEYTAKTDVVPGQHLIVSRDVTERKNREQELERMRDLFEEVQRLGNLGAWEVNGDENLRWTEGTRRIHEVGADFEPTLADALEFFHPDDRQRVEEAIIDARGAGKTYDIEARINTATGAVRWVRASGGPVDYSETIRGYIQDITRQKERERETQQLKERLELAVEGAQLGVWDWDMSTGDIELNEQYLEMLGYSKEEFGHHVEDWKTRIHPDDREQMEAAVDEHVAGETEYFEMEYRLQTVEGDWKWLRSLGRIVDRDDDGSPVRAVGIQIDISQREEREQKLEWVETAFQNAQDAMFLIDVGADNEFRLQRTNEAYRDVTGFADEEITGKPPTEIVGDEAGTEIESRYRDCVERREPVVYEEEIPVEGEIKYWETKLTPLSSDGNVTQLFGVTRDITGRKDRDRLELVESLATQLSELASDLLQIGHKPVTDKIDEALDTIGTLVDADRSYVFEINQNEETTSNTHEWTAEGVEPQIDELQNIPFDTLPWWIEQMEARDPLVIPAVSDLPPEASAEQEILEAQDIESLIVSPMISEGELIGFIGFDWVENQESWSDDFIHILRLSGEIISSAIQRESRRRELERREAYLEQSTDIISVMDADGTVKYQSASTERVTDFSPADVIGDSGFEHVHPDDLEQFGTEFPSFVSQPDEELQAELRVETKDGSWKWIEVRGVNKLADPVIDGLLFSSRDITERKEREQELRRERDRLDEFVSVVSHDLRNPLNVAQGRIELAQAECDTDHLDAAASGVERSLDLIEDMLQLARAGHEVSDTEPVPIADLVNACWKTVETTDASLVVDLDSTLRADRSRLRQLLENLFRNAVKHGGKDVTVNVGSLSGGFYVEDDGPGIPEESRGGVWEAGYSGADDGTGIGLSVVQQIVAAHDWSVRITDGSSGGARFEITGIEVIAE